MPNYYLNLFSVDTWRAFREHGCSISGFSKHQRGQASKIEPGSLMLCYLVGVSRWVGVLRVDSRCFEDSTPIFSEGDDKFIIRFSVTPLVTLQPESGIPITDEKVWSTLEWTKNIRPGAVGWGANFQRSLREIPQSDGRYLAEIMTVQSHSPAVFPLEPREQRLLKQRAKIKTQKGTISVEIPDESEEDTTADFTPSDIRESLKIQAALAKIGAVLNFKVWIPKTDATQLGSYLDSQTKSALLDELPLAFDDAVVRTIENIDVLWLNNRTIIRAFEVEHTTAIYSGLLRMADLLALVPNLNLPLHIVAPQGRKEKVFKEINRPVFQLMEKKLSDCCSFLSYEKVLEILELRQLQHMNHSIVAEYEEFTDY
jgi:hypothetical protein